MSQVGRASPRWGPASERELYSSMDPISAQITDVSAPIRGPWTTACINTGSMDGISPKKAEEIVHELDICTKGRSICTDAGSMDDSGATARTDAGSMDDSGTTACTDIGSMDD